MATNSLHCCIQHQHQHHSLLKRLHPSDTPPITSLFLKPPTLPLSRTHTHNPPHSTSHIISSLSQTTATLDLDLLRRHLAAGDFLQADEETRRLLIALAGEAAQKRGYVFFSEVQFIPESELRSIDSLWREHSEEKFGYSVQKKILDKANGDFTKFFVKVGWMKKLDTEVVQYNYRSFPTEFMWELSHDTPEGHLPLTNALRGTQLLSNVLNHPAFLNKQDGDDNGALTPAAESKTFTQSQRILKTDYSF